MSCSWVCQWCHGRISVPEWIPDFVAAIERHRQLCPDAQRLEAAR